MPAVRRHKEKLSAMSRGANCLCGWWKGLLRQGCLRETREDVEVEMRGDVGVETLGLRGRIRIRAHFLESSAKRRAAWRLPRKLERRWDWLEVGSTGGGGGAGIVGGTGVGDGGDC